MHNQTLHDIAEQILKAFAGTRLGHCVRVDDFDGETARRLVQLVNAGRPGPQIEAYVLQPAHIGFAEAISTDRAIELRNRKERSLCLFIPSDLVDSAASSLANSFAPLSGSRLLSQVRDAAVRRLPRAAQLVARDVLRETAKLQIAAQQQIQFIAALGDYAAQGRTSEAGELLSLVNLLPDRRADFATHLPRNRQSVQRIARPRRSSSDLSARLAELKLLPDVERRLTDVLRRLPLSNPAIWIEPLVQAGLTFDHWKSRQDTDVDLLAVTVKPLRDRKGNPTAVSKLKLIDGRLTALFGEKGARITVSWVSDPLQPRDVAQWQAELVAQEAEAELPDGWQPIEQLLKGDKRSVTFKLDERGHDAPTSYMVVRVTALDAGGSPLSRDGQLLQADSEPFVLTRGSTEPPPPPKRTVSQTALGMLQLVVQSGKALPPAGSAGWVKGTTTALWQVSFGEGTGKKQLAVRVSAPLRDLQLKVLSGRRNDLGRFVLDEPAPGSSGALPWQTVATPELSKGWKTFLDARADFFERLRLSGVEAVVEVADWQDNGLVSAVIAYAAAYEQLLTGLQQADARRELEVALSIDTAVLRRVGSPDALLILPTHPLRALWFASYSRLLQTWSDDYLARGAARADRPDLALLQQITPANLPAFALSPDHHGPRLHSYVDTISIGYAVMLPGTALSPQQRLQEIAALLEWPLQDERDAATTQLNARFSEFIRAHPHVDPLQLRLVNTSLDGPVGTALAALAPDVDDDGAEVDMAQRLPDLAITTYLYEQATATTGSGMLQERYPAQRRRKAGIAFQPRIATTVRHIDQLEQSTHAHITVIADLTRRRLQVIDEPQSAAAGSYSFYGLVCRPTVEMQHDAQGTRWIAAMAAGHDAPAPHPAGRQFDALSRIHQRYYRALGYEQAIGRNHHLPRAVPALIGDIQQASAERLPQLLAGSDWVITLDGFLSAAYIDDSKPDGIGGSTPELLVDGGITPPDGRNSHVMLIGTRAADARTAFGRAARWFGMDLDETMLRLLFDRLRGYSGQQARRLTESIEWAQHGLITAAAISVLTDEHPGVPLLLLPLEQDDVLISPEQLDAAERCDLFAVRLDGQLQIEAVAIAPRAGNSELEPIVTRLAERTDQSMTALRQRFFTSGRVDAALQRLTLATMLRQSVDTAHRRKELSDDDAAAYRERISGIETGAEQIGFRQRGMIISLDRDGEALQFSQDTILIQLVTRSRISSLAARRSNAAAEAVRPLVLGRQAGQEVHWQPGGDDPTHLYLVGDGGTGKTQTLQRLVVAMAEQGQRPLVIDLAGSLSQELRGRDLPLHIISAEHGIPINPLDIAAAGSGRYDTAAHAAQLAELLSLLYDLGEVQQELLLRALTGAYEGLTDNGNDGPPGAAPLPAALHAALVALERAHGIDDVAERLAPLVKHGPFHTESTDLLNEFMGGLIVDLSRLATAELRTAAALMLVHHLPAAAPGRHILLDSLEHGHDTPLGSLLQRAAAFGSSVIAAGRPSLPLSRTLLSAFGTRLFFRHSYPASRQLTAFLDSEDDQLELQLRELAQGRALLQSGDGTLASIDLSDA